MALYMHPKTLTSVKAVNDITLYSYVLILAKPIAMYVAAAYQK